MVKPAAGKPQAKPALRSPRSAAVTVTVLARDKTSLVEAMAEARSKIVLRDLGIEDVRKKRRVTAEVSCWRSPARTARSQPIGSLRGCAPSWRKRRC